MLTVLIVEDTVDTRDLWSLVFETAGFEVIVADTVAGGLAALRSTPRVDVVVTDYGLEDGNGESMLREAASHGLLRDVATILCTANERVRVSEIAVVVHKPILPHDLLAVARSLVGVRSSERSRRAAIDGTASDE